MITFQENGYIERFLKKEKIERGAFSESLEERWSVVCEHPTKIKVAGGYSYQGNKLYEFKITHKQQDYRVAFFYQGKDCAEVVFISKEIIKRDFIRSLSKINIIHL